MSRHRRHWSEPAGERGDAQSIRFFRSVGGEDMIAKLAFIAAHIGNHSIRLLCRVLGVSRSWFHNWQRTAPERAARAARHEALIEEIKAIFEDSKQRYGAPRIHAEPRDRGHRVSRKLGQQARTCIFDRLQEQLANTLIVDREVRRREATSGVVGGWRVGTVICRVLEPVL